MNFKIKSAAAAALLSALAACGSSSTTTTDVAKGSNGLPYATNDIAALLDGLDQTETLNLIFKSLLFNEDNTSTVLNGEASFTFTPGAEPGDLEAGNGTLEIDFGGGATSSFDVVGGTVLSDPGSEFTADELEGVASLLLSTTFFVGEDEIEIKDYFVVGFETSPADMAALAAVDTGFVTYTGNFAGIGNATNAGLAGGAEFFDIEAVSLAGTTNIEADFASGAVQGNLDINEITVISSGFDAFTSMGGSVLSLEFEPSTLDGNTFNMTGASVNTCGDCVEGVVNNADLDGTFYGADAAEVSGLAAFDVDIIDNGGGIDDSFNLVGVGGFIAGEEPPIILFDE